MSENKTSLHPLVSIITVVYNDSKLLDRTIQSVTNQTYPHIEYIVIDGGSKDNTLEVIKKYSKNISYWVSEPDKGLYDAMNKGIKAAKGDYVWFMNAGDEIYSTDTLEKVINTSPEPVDIYYGETMYITPSYVPLGLRSVVTPHKLPEHLKWTDLENGMVVCHQSIIIKKDIAELYDLNHPYCADIDWIIKALKKSKKIVNTNLILSRYLKGGISDKRRLNSLKDRFKVLSKHFGFVKTMMNHFYITARAVGFRMGK